MNPNTRRLRAVSWNRVLSRRERGAAPIVGFRVRLQDNVGSLYADIQRRGNSEFASRKVKRPRPASEWARLPTVWSQ